MGLLDEIARRVSPFSLAGRALRLPFRLVPRDAVVPVLSGINRGKRWIAGSASTNGSWIGTYDAHHVQALEKLIQKGMVVYDAGANVGFYTLALSTLVGDSGHVFSFEPNARNVSMLLRHVELNNLRNVTVVQAAVSSSSGFVGFGGQGEMGSVVAESNYRVPSISLDEFVAAGNPVPAFIKMDIEGAERAALEGAASLLTPDKTAWMMATHSAALRTECREVMTKRGYCITDFDCVTDPGEHYEFLALAGHC
jgi:FkbM family methyltransferase